MNTMSCIVQHITATFGWKNTVTNNLHCGTSPWEELSIGLTTGKLAACYPKPVISESAPVCEALLYA
jgi:hypothetical protein